MAPEVTWAFAEDELSPLDVEAVVVGVVEADPELVAEEPLDVDADDEPLDVDPDEDEPVVAAARAWVLAWAATSAMPPTASSDPPASARVTARARLRERRRGLVSG